MTNWLEHKIPPPIVAAAIASAMWFLSRLLPASTADTPSRVYVAAVLAAVGLAIMAVAIAQFSRARTTINPIDIAKASRLVTGGIFGLTRNPMYLGMTLVLIGWAVYLAAPVAFVGPILFAAFITRYQILPEERVMRERFGAEFEAYSRRTRRWL